MIIIVLPTYNEEEGIADLLCEIKATMREEQIEYQVIVVNDGSTDRTEEVVANLAAELPLLCLKHPSNAGLGEAIRTGLLKAVEIGGERDIIVTMDSDNTHVPGLILRLVRMTREGRDVVIASRFQPESYVQGVTLLRRILSRCASLLFQVFYPMAGVRDYTCGYRAYRWKTLKDAFAWFGTEFVSSTGFSCMVEILLKLRSRSVIAGEAPMVLRYDQKAGISKMKVKENILDTLALLWKARKFEQ
ncbi:MAG: glycosyltransferase family 2 protein [Acidobacteria bacterium]|nr:glycosyltransferase family 2 protein [Acidobacteriota bacterium]MCI0721168.1 glycosyltransferase family 2 protein [Acidobacteriota bacterium]